MSNTIKKRRKAINCVLVSESKTSPGYFKYKVTIQEINGDVYDVPAYGIDMQDAIKRLLAVEKAEKIQRIYTNKIEPSILIGLGLAWLASIVTTLITDNYIFAWYGILGMMGVALGIGLYKIFRGL